MKKYIIHILVISTLFTLTGCAKARDIKPVNTNLKTIVTTDTIQASKDKFNKVLDNEKAEQLRIEQEKKAEEEKRQLEEKQKAEEQKKIEEEKARQQEYARWHYKSNSMQIDLEPFSKTSPNIKYWVAHIKINSANQLKTAFQHDSFGGTRERTSTITKNHGGILGINASGFSFNTGEPSGIIIRDGKVYRGGKGQPMCITNDGTMFVPDSAKTQNELLQMGVKHTFSFGPLLIKNGQALEVKNGQPDGNYPRTAIGQISPTEYYVITADGKRQDYSIGLTPKQMQEEFLSRGVKFAYNLDGGGSTALYFNGRVVNIPSDNNGEERPVADIIYFSN